MAKFLIFALMALPACSSLWLGFLKLEREGVKDQLKGDFELTPDDLKEECNVHFQSEWRKIGAALDKYNAIYRRINGNVIDFPDTDKKTNKRYLAECRKSKPYKKAVMNVIKTALPCAEKDSQDKHFESAKPHICPKF